MINPVRLSCWAAVAGTPTAIIAMLVVSITVPGHALDGQKAQSGGNILMAIPILRGRVGPRWVGFVPHVGAPAIPDHRGAAHKPCA